MRSRDTASWGRRRRQKRKVSKNTLETPNVSFTRKWFVRMKRNSYYPLMKIRMRNLTLFTKYLKFCFEKDAQIERIVINWNAHIWKCYIITTLSRKYVTKANINQSSFFAASEATQRLAKLRCRRLGTRVSSASEVCWSYEKCPSHGWRLPLSQHLHTNRR